MTFAQRRNRLTTRFAERIPVVKRRMSVFISSTLLWHVTPYSLVDGVSMGAIALSSG